MKQPFDYHPDLISENISIVAQLISQAYHNALNYHMPEMGDNKWSLGCRRYVWVRHMIAQAAESEEFSFLSILENEGQKFTFKIGDVPVRFKRTEAENPDPSIFQQYEAEASQLSLCLFEGFDDPCYLGWRMLVEDDIEGDVVRIVFVGAQQNGNIECFWPIPKEHIEPNIVALTSDKEQGVELEAASVGLKVQNYKNKKA